MASKRLLLLFVRNPELGKVKTRLAATVGPEKALEIYLHLLQHTRDVTQQLPEDKLVYYSDKVQHGDLWPEAHYQKAVQPSGDLGERMEVSFAAAFQAAYTSVVIIGSDCQQLTQAIIERAFLELEKHDVVIGPALDGGYYLLGMKQLQSAFFRGKQWSTEHVFPATLQDIHHLQLSYALLPSLSDVDQVEDLENPEQWLGAEGK
jgi:rSAM/selenodomain-associated transferase 1